MRQAPSIHGLARLFLVCSLILLQWLDSEFEGLCKRFEGVTVLLELLEPLRRSRLAAVDAVQLSLFQHASSDINRDNFGVTLMRWHEEVTWRSQLHKDMIKRPEKHVFAEQLTSKRTARRLVQCYSMSPTYAHRTRASLLHRQVRLSSTDARRDNATVSNRGYIRQHRDMLPRRRTFLVRFSGGTAYQT